MTLPQQISVSGVFALQTLFHYFFSVEYESPINDILGHVPAA